EAGAPQGIVLFDNCGLHAQLGASDSCHISSGTGADDSHIVLIHMLWFVWIIPSWITCVKIQMFFRCTASLESLGEGRADFVPVQRASALQVQPGTVFHLPDHKGALGVPDIADRREFCDHELPIGL